jgi:hypothetical protein
VVWIFLQDIICFKFFYNFDKWKQIKNINFFTMSFFIISKMTRYVLKMVVIVKKKF